MLEVGKRYTSPATGTWVAVTERAGDVLTFERSYAPGTGRGLPHRHEDFTETFEAVSGAGMVEVEGTEQPLRKGDTIVIEPGTKHRNPWNPGAERFHVRARFDPTNDFLETFWAAYAQHLIEGEDGRLTKQEELPFLQIMVIASETNGRSYGASPPVPVQRALRPLLAAAGRMWGYQARYG